MIANLQLPHISGEAGMAWVFWFDLLILLAALLIIAGAFASAGAGAMWMWNRLADRRTPVVLTLPVDHPDARNVMGPAERDEWDGIVADLAS